MSYTPRRLPNLSKPAVTFPGSKCLDTTNTSTPRGFRAQSLKEKENVCVHPPSRTQKACQQPLQVSWSWQLPMAVRPLYLSPARMCWHLGRPGERQGIQDAGQPARLRTRCALALWLTRLHSFPELDGVRVGRGHTGQRETGVRLPRNVLSPLLSVCLSLCRSLLCVVITGATGV